MVQGRLQCKGWKEHGTFKECSEEKKAYRSYLRGIQEGGQPGPCKLQLAFCFYYKCDEKLCEGFEKGKGMT